MEEGVKGLGGVSAVQDFCCRGGEMKPLFLAHPSEQTSCYT